MAYLLPEADINTQMKKVPEWDLAEDLKSIYRIFEHDDFMEAIDFVNGVAEIAEEENHHPDIDIRWTNVQLTLSSHSAGGLTANDFDLAKKIETLVE